MTAMLTSDSRETRVIPPGHNAVLHQVLQFTFREYGVDKVDSAEVEDLDLGETKFLQEPLILLVTGIVLVRSQRVSDTIQVVDNRAGEVVHWVRFVFVSSAISIFLICIPCHPIVFRLTP